MKRFHRRLVVSKNAMVLALTLGAAALPMSPWLSPVHAEERNADIAQLERDLAEAGRTGALPTLQKAWQIRFDGAVGPGERISLEVMPAIPVQDGDPESRRRFDRLREQVKQAFELHKQDTGVFTVVLRDGTKLLTSQGMVIPLRFVFKRLVTVSSETSFAGYGQSGCSITTQFFATGTREPLRLGENPTLARFAFKPEGIAVLQGYQGQQRSPALRRCRCRSAPMLRCHRRRRRLSSKRPRRRSYRRRRPSRLRRFPSPFRCHAA